MLSDEYGEFMASYEADSLRALRLNPLRFKEEDCPLFFDDLKPVLWEPMGRYFDDSFIAGKHPYHEAGVYYIQEPSAMAPVSYLDVLKGDRILDLCAAPGGKSTQIAGKMMGTGLLVSNEIHPGRAKILSENIERLGISNAIVTNETPDRLSDKFHDYFDKILVDAPCSGEGMFRKNEEALSEWSKDNVILCADRQDEILDNAHLMLKAGGRLVYSTCTFAPDENEGTIFRFITRHPEYRVINVPMHPGMEHGRVDFLRPDIIFGDNTIYEKLFSNDSDMDDIREQIGNTIRLLPHKIKGEGHFIAVLIKGEEGTVEMNGYVKGGQEKSIDRKTLDIFREFSDAHLPSKGLIDSNGQNPQNGIFTRFGDQLYLLPPSAPSLKGLKVVRPGLHLGTYLKNRFEPAHALAHSLCQTDVVNYISLPADSEETKQYLRGESLRISVNEGTNQENITVCIRNEKAPWTLVCVDDYPLGFAKYSSGVFKNHYPKGLRKSC